MLPSNAREGDFVIVSNEESVYFGMVGRIKQLLPKAATVDIYGKLTDIPKEELSLKARKGTGTHDEITQQIKERECDNLDVEGYNGLIDFAIDCKDWKWAEELIHRRDKLQKRKKR